MLRCELCAALRWELCAALRNELWAMLRLDGAAVPCTLLRLADGNANLPGLGLVAAPAAIPISLFDLSLSLYSACSLSLSRTHWNPTVPGTIVLYLKSVCQR